MYHFTGVRGSPGVALMAIGRAAENCDELAPLHSITSSARASSVGGTPRPRALAVLRFMISSTFVICWTGKSRCRNAMLKTAHGWRKLRREAQLMSVCLRRAQPAVERSPALPGKTYLGFSLFALGVPDSAPVSPRQLAVQSASAARQSFGTAYGMSLL